MSSTAPPVMQCHLVNSVSVDPVEQCKFLIDNNCLDDDSFIDYVFLIYCRIGYDFRLLITVLIIFLVILLFLAISAIADDFLCTSLLTVSRNLKMSDSLAGITLLAFGNGCPDIFSSIAAAYDARSEMIIGELLGAGIFCTSVVSGLVFINSDFKLACRPILRDTSFYLLAVYLIWCYSQSEQITFYGALSFIIIYIVYLSVALFGQVLGARLRGNYMIEHQVTNESHTNSVGDQLKMGCGMGDDENGRREDSIKKNSNQAKATRPSPERRPIIKVDHNAGVTSVHLGWPVEAASKEAPLKIQLFPSQLRSTSNSTQTSSAGAEAAGCCFTNQAFVVEDAAAAHANQKEDKQPKTNQQREMRPPPGLPPGGHQKLHVHELPPSEVSCQILSQTRPANNNKLVSDIEAVDGGSEWDSFLVHINPIETADWPTISLTAKIIRILRAPTILLGQLTIPMVDNQKILNNWCRPLNALHFLTVPLFIMLTTVLRSRSNLEEAGLATSSTSSSAGVGYSLSNLLGAPTPVAELVVATLLAGYLFHLTSPHRAPKYHAAFAYVGFGMSVFWVYLLASEMISLMKTIGLVFGMSDTSIGLGILAWGNSLGDIVANYSLTKANYPRMALGACIGAPLLNLLLGFGLSFTISLKPGQFSHIQYSPTITLLCSTLAIILLSLMLTTLLPPYASKRPIGYLLIAGYLVYFAAAVCLEYKLVNF